MMCTKLRLAWECPRYFVIKWVSKEEAEGSQRFVLGNFTIHLTGSAKTPIQVEVTAGISCETLGCSGR